MTGRAVVRWLAIALFIVAPLALAIAAGAATPKFPALTGRVVDEAKILSENTRATLSQTLDAFERDTKRQVVIATVADLQGYEIDEYGYQLGRHWGIGEKDKDTGAILLIAPKERQVRIEVGYGLEGELTDAISRRIIEQDILPQFRAGSFDAGVTNGTLAILRTLGWQGAGPAPQRAPVRGDQQSLASFLLPFGMFLLFMFLTNRMGRRRGPWGRVYRGGGPWGRGGFGPGGFGGGFGGGRGGGGFRGGGGSFGGGGASGRW